MQNQTGQKTCLVTGTNGYLGSRVRAALQSHGWRVVALTRQPEPGGIRFQLGENLPQETLAGAEALVHCAYDFKQISWPDIQRVNVAGSEKLLRAVQAAGIKSVVHISSISAFDGCRSLYGRAKLETEKIARSLGAYVIRPGLIYGDSPDGMFGKLVAQVNGAKLLPLFGGGAQIQFLVHEADLCGFICRCAAREIAPPENPVTLAHEQPWTFRQILESIARSHGKKLSFIPVPWRFVWAGIKCAELLRVPLNFRSDSLVSLIYQNPHPSFAEQRELRITCRPFAVKSS